MLENEPDITPLLRDHHIIAEDILGSPAHTLDYKDVAIAAVHALLALNHTLRSLDD